MSDNQGPLWIPAPAENPDDQMYVTIRASVSRKAYDNDPEVKRLIARIQAEVDAFTAYLSMRGECR